MRSDRCAWTRAGLLFATLPLLVACAHAEAKPAEKQRDPALRQVVADVCDSHLVFLGEEGSHGGASAFVVKSQLLEELIEQCKFRHVVFESQVYDFENLKERYVAGTATKAALLDAIGGIWATNAELEPLLNDLHARALQGGIMLSGMDGQIGSSMGLYTQTMLGGDIAVVLDDPRKKACAATIDRLTSWTFDAEHPDDANFRREISSCLDDALVAADTSRSVSDARKMVIRSFREQLKFSDKDYFNQRDRLMAENLRTILTSLPPETKTVVWTANVHALRQPNAGNRATASYFADEDKGAVRSIGLVALSGQYGRQGRPATTIEPAEKNSLERTAVPVEPALLAYVTSSELASRDQMGSRLLGYSAYQQAAWSRLFDGVVVLKDERQPNFIRPRTPRQTDE